MALKTKKAVSKRIKINKSGKLMRRAMGQGHNMSKSSGELKRLKRRRINIALVDEKKMLKYLPYN